MKFKQFLTDAAMNPGAFRDVEKRIGEMAKVGFEFEFLVGGDNHLYDGEDEVRLSSGEDWGKDEDGNVSDDSIYSTGMMVLTALEDELGIEPEFSMAAHGESKELGTWYLEPDSSITGESGVGLELVSPPLKLTDALKFLPKVCKFMSDNDLETNESTGFHINVSVPNIDSKLDKTKLILFLGEKYAAKVFGREANIYTKPQISHMLRNVMAAGRIPKSFSTMSLTATKNISLNDKYVSVNFKHLFDGGEYLEFRIAGGKNYHERVDELRNTVLRFVRAVELACDPQAERNEYAKKLAKFFNMAQGELIGNDETLFARFKKPNGSVLTANTQFQALDKQARELGPDFVLTQKTIFFIDSLFIEEGYKNIALTEVETGALRKLVAVAKISSVNVDAFYASLSISDSDVKVRREKFKRVFKL